MTIDTVLSFSTKHYFLIITRAELYSVIKFDKNVYKTREIVICVLYFRIDFAHFKYINLDLIGKRARARIQRSCRPDKIRFCYDATGDELISNNNRKHTRQ